MIGLQPNPPMLGHSALHLSASNFNFNDVKSCGESTSPYSTVAKWVKSLKKGNQNVTHIRQPEGLHVIEEEVYTLIVP